MKEKMETPIGREIQQKVKEDPRKVAEICAAVGIHPSYISKVYRKKDIKLSLIKRFEAVLGHDFLRGAIPGKEIGTGSPEPAAIEIHACQVQAKALKRELKHYERQLVDLRARIRDKDKIIRLLQSQLHGNARH